MFENLKNGWKIGSTTRKLVFKEKRLFIFPILASIFAIIEAIAIFVPVFLVATSGIQMPAIILGLFAYYIIVTFTGTYMIMAMMIAFKDNSRGIKTGYIAAYAYSRMLLSALADPWIIERFADGIAARSVSAILSDLEKKDLPHLIFELGFKVERMAGWEFKADLFALLASEVPLGDPGLVGQRLHEGSVILDFDTTVKICRTLAKKRVMEGLPLPRGALPKYVIEAARGIKAKLPQRKVLARGSGGDSIGWIDDLLTKPIIDGRHRVINLVLAPYLVTIKKLPAEEAAKVIGQYIDRCRQVNPDTKVNEQYIFYQCKYAEKKGTKPLSRSRAQEFLPVGE